MTVSIKEAMELLGVSQATLYREIERGNLVTVGQKNIEQRITLESIYKLREEKKK